MQEPTPENLKNNCRHEYVRIYQRRLKGLERRLVSTRAYLPTGFKLGDFSHLSEGSYCFCTKCRTRLFPKRTNAERAQARLLAAQGKALEAELLEAQELADALENQESQELAEMQDNQDSGVDVNVDELLSESVDAQDIAADGVKINEEQSSCELLEEEG